LNGITVIDENTNPEVQPKTNTSKSQGYSKVFMRDYANVQVKFRNKYLMLMKKGKSFGQAILREKSLRNSVLEK